MGEKIQYDPNRIETQESRKKLKLFGEEAERVNRKEYFTVAEEILIKIDYMFKNTKIIEPLQDKEDNGDIDIICLSWQKLNRKIFENVLGNQLMNYSHNAGVYSLLFDSKKIDKKVHVDIIKTKDKEDFERRKMFLSKGHLSAAIGILAKGLNFKYAQEGFFKRYKDTKGQWHSISIGDLKEGLKILGFDADQWSRIKSTNDIIDFLKKSPFFTSKAFEQSQLTGKRKDGYKRVFQQKNLFDKLAKLGQETREIDQDKYLKELYPKWYQKYQREVEKIEKELKFKKVINGKLIIETFDVKPGHVIGKILRYIKENYPDTKELTAEMTEDVKNKFKL